MKVAEAASEIAVKNILFATDFSSTANHALTYAAELARRFGASLYAVHAKTPDYYALASPESWPALQQACEVDMGKLRERLATEFPEVKSDVLVGEGRVWPVLEYVIENKEIDLIVVGTHGRTGVRKFFLGSVAEDMVRRASCPVLTVGPLSPSGKDHAASFTEILCATDFSAGSLNAVPYAIYLATGYPSHVTLLHVIEPDKAINGNQGKLEDTAAAQMRALMPTGSNLPYRFQLIVEHGLAAPKILEVANRRGADLIVLGARRVGRIAGGATHLASVANTVIAYSTCPVLTVRG